MKLPIGIQNFEKLRTGGYLYIDKTKYIFELIESGSYYFLSRPRRFGKSLMVSTLQALFEGKKELFKGLWIESHWDWSKANPVILLQSSKSDYQAKGLDEALKEEIRLNAKRLGISLEQTSLKSSFYELISKAGTSNRVVILIDEYDKPIIDYLDDLEQAKANRQILKNLYSVLKDSDRYIEFLFMTGVSRFAKTSIFSDLNHLINITIDRFSSQLLGVTQEELDTYFSKEIDSLAINAGLTSQYIKEQIKVWYNGYSWNGGETKLYNPFSLLNLFRSSKFDNFWFETGTPTFLIKLMRKSNFYKIETIQASDQTLNSYEIESINPITILFQTGYLTISNKLAVDIYELRYPNKEVKISLEERLLNAFSYDEKGSGKAQALNMADALRQQNIDRFISIINATFSTIPNQLWQKENEAFYHALLHLSLSLMGAYIQSELNTSNGRMDAKVETPEVIYILEFKLDQSAEVAIQQIEEKGYFKPYQETSKQKIGVGINFSSKKKAVDSLITKTF